MAPRIRRDLELWGDCLAGALTEQEFLVLAKEAGFHGLEVLERSFYREVEGVRFYSINARGFKLVKGERCIYIGHYAIYKGPFSEATDDQGRTFPRGIPVEVSSETAKKLQRPPYGNLFLLADPSRENVRAYSPRCC